MAVRKMNDETAAHSFSEHHQRYLRTTSDGQLSFGCRPNGLRVDPDWKLRVFTLEVTSDGGRTRDANDYILKRSAEERSHCHGRELLQQAR
jgi:hypothetical protein